MSISMLNRCLAPWQRVRAVMDAPSARLYLLHRLLQRASGGRAGIVAYVLLAQPLNTQALTSLKDDGTTAIERWPSRDPRGHQLPRPWPVLSSRWDAGARCYGAELKGEVAGCIWICANGHHDEDEVRCSYQLPPDGVWDFDVWVAPRWRLGRTLARLWKAVDEDLSAEGKRWTFSRISRFNTASLAAHMRLGARPVGRFTALQLGEFELHFQPGHWPRWSLRQRSHITLAAPR